MGCRLGRFRRLGVQMLDDTNHPSPAHMWVYMWVWIHDNYKYSHTIIYLVSIFGGEGDSNPRYAYTHSSFRDQWNICNSLLDIPYLRLLVTVLVSHDTKHRATTVNNRGKRFWRRGGDSNPRYAYTYSSFRVQPISS